LTIYYGAQEKKVRPSMRNEEGLGRLEALPYVGRRGGEKVFKKARVSGYFRLFQDNFGGGGGTNVECKMKNAESGSVAPHHPHPQS
jgi:hypothetical protein